MVRTARFRARTALPLPIQRGKNRSPKKQNGKHTLNAARAIKLNIGIQVNSDLPRKTPANFRPSRAKSDSC